jgi:hypothetical protein
MTYLYLRRKFNPFTHRVSLCLLPKLNPDSSASISHTAVPGFEFENAPARINALAWYTFRLLPVTAKPIANCNPDQKTTLPYTDLPYGMSLMKTSIGNETVVPKFIDNY